VSCLAVRDQLAEFAVGVLPKDEEAAVERHLQWCAGCRKEAAELGQAASTFAFALSPESPPVGLEDRVVAEVRRTAATPTARRRTGAVLAAVVAAAIAVAGLGWGSVMAGKARSLADQTRQLEAQQERALERFQHLLANLPGSHPGETHLGRLVPTQAVPQGGGVALQLVSPTRLDFAFVVVNGLPKDPALLPYQVTLRDGRGRVLRVGRITQLDAGGGAESFRQFKNTDLTGYTRVVVLDASGRPVLMGTVDQSQSA
jgi:Putative zinc-finger